MTISLFSRRSTLGVAHLLFAAVLLPASAGPVAAQTFTTLNDPLGPNYTFAYGISVNNIVWFHYPGTQGEYASFLHGSTYKTLLNDPLAFNYTEAFGISGSNIVGWYQPSSALLMCLVFSTTARHTRR